MHAVHYGGDASHEKYKEVTTMSHWADQARLARSLDVASSMCMKYIYLTNLPSCCCCDRCQHILKLQNMRLSDKVAIVVCLYCA